MYPFKYPVSHLEDFPFTLRFRLVSGEFTGTGDNQALRAKKTSLVASRKTTDINLRDSCASFGVIAASGFTDS